MTAQNGTWASPRHFETNEIISERRLNEDLVEPNKFLYDWLAKATAFGSSANIYTVNAGANTWQNDSSGLAVAVTTEVVSDIYVYIQCIYRVAAGTHDAIFKARAYNSSDSVGGDDITRYVGSSNADCQHDYFVVNKFNDVAAGTKNFILQGARQDGTATPEVVSRTILCIAVSQIT